MANVPWGIQYDGFIKTVTDWGVAQIKRKRNLRTADSVTFATPGRAFDATPLFAHGSTVTILRGVVPWFVGRVTGVPGDGTPEGESQSYTLAGPWWYLDNLIYQQTWKTNRGDTEDLLGRCILGQTLNGTRQNTGEVIHDVLQFAIDCGAPLQIGTIDPDFSPPISEVKEVTCADVIEQMLRWHPDCVSWFDYGTPGSPTIHARKRANLTATTLALGVPPLSSVTGLTARNDLGVSAVVIRYEISGEQNGRPSLKVVTDAYPEGSNGKTFKAVVMTVPMRGENSTSVSQPVLVRGIVDEKDDPDLTSYLIAAGDSQLKKLYDDPAVTSIDFTECVRRLTDTTATVPDGQGGTQSATANLTLLNELREGALTDWMIKQYNLKEERQNLDFSYTYTKSGAVSGPVKASYAFRATNASTGVYATLTSYQQGDSAPTGLAAAYYGALNTLQYSGNFTVVEEEPTGVVGLGMVVNLLGSAQAEHATMCAMIVDESVDVETGTTTVTVGPPEHLSLADIVSLHLPTRPNSGNGRSGSPVGKATENSEARVHGGTVATGGTEEGENASNKTVAGSVVLPRAMPVSSVTYYSSPTNLSAPLSIIDASDDTHAGRVRILNGTLAGVTPTEMHIPDGVLSNGTDNSCYLTMNEGTNYVYGKVHVDGSNGTYASASVYRTDSTEELDGTYVYLLIGIVDYNSSTKAMAISQYVTGSQPLLVAASGDGTILQPLWGSGNG